MINTVWIEIPVQDIERAAKFYQTVFELPSADIVSDDVRRTCTLSNDMSGGRPGLSLTQVKGFEPGLKGAYLYFDTKDNLEPFMSRIEAAGGKMTTPKMSMGSTGFYVSFQDTEGNLLGLYSSK